MVLKTDLMELKKRYKKDKCTFQRLAGIYVHIDKTKSGYFNRTFLNLEDDEFYKYLDIAKKTISGPIGNNILELKLNNNSDMSKLLNGLIRSELKDEGLINTLADRIIEKYEYQGCYLILFFYDVYDVPVKTTDKMKLDEAEESYAHIIVSICPMTMPKPGLGYNEPADTIGVVKRDMMVDAPANGFLYPSFAERSADTDTVTTFTKDKKNPYGACISEILDCEKKKTEGEVKEVFKQIIKGALSEEDKEDRENYAELIDESLSVLSDNEDIIDAPIIKKVLKEHGVPSEICAEIADNFKLQLGDENIKSETLASAKSKNNTLSEVDFSDTTDVYINVPSDKKDNVIKKEVNGVMSIVIQIEDLDKIRVNGSLF